MLGVLNLGHGIPGWCWHPVCIQLQRRRTQAMLQALEARFRFYAMVTLKLSHRP